MFSFSAKKWYGSLLAVLLGSTWVQADDQWVGKEVIPKRGTPNITQTNDKIEVIVIGKIDYYPAPVREEKGDWVKVQVQDKARWILKNEVVRADEGTQYFTSRIQAKDDLVEAYANELGYGR